MTPEAKARIENVQKIVRDVIASPECGGLRLSEENKEWLEKIDTLPRFYKADLGDYKPASEKKGGEREYQREVVYNTKDERREWLDIEIPTGWVRGHKTLDLIGRDKGSEDNRQFILCELKKGGSHPFDTLLQVLAYYLMIQQNAEKMDDDDVHHTNAKCKDFEWVNVRDNVRLLIQAKGGWGRHRKPKMIALDEIIKACEKVGLKIEVDPKINLP